MTVVQTLATIEATALEMAADSGVALHDCWPEAVVVVLLDTPRPIAEEVCRSLGYVPHELARRWAGGAALDEYLAAVDERWFG